MQAEAYALIGDENGLLAVWQDRQGNFGGELEPGEYFQTNYKYLLHDIPDLVRVY